MFGKMSRSSRASVVLPLDEQPLMPTTTALRSAVAMAGEYAGRGQRPVEDGGRTLCHEKKVKQIHQTGFYVLRSIVKICAEAITLRILPQLPRAGAVPQQSGVLGAVAWARRMVWWRPVQERQVVASSCTCCRRRRSRVSAATNHLPRDLSAY